MSSVIVRPQVKRVVVRTPGPQGPPGDVTGATVTSVAGRVGDVTLTKGDVGLSNVDNTADASKPVSAAQAAADTAVGNAAATDATTKANAAQTSAEATAATALSTHAAATSSVHGISAFGATLVDDASASAARTTLGLGTAATAATGDFAAASHTHALSALTQSGATTGQIVQWNGTAWVPVTFTSGIGGTLGTTDNALTRADGTGGATAQGSGVTCDDSANLSATNWIVGSGVFGGRTFSRHSSVGADVALIIGPTGTGFISSQVPDGTVTGGNLRGNNAVDFTQSRSLAANVASGASSVAFQSSRASGANSVAFGSAYATASYAFGAGQDCSASGSYSFAHGFTNTASGTSAYAFGLFSTASASYSWASGERASAPLYGQFSESSGMFGASGDAQHGRVRARRATTDATPSNLFLDGSSARWVVPANSSGTAMVTVVARTATAGAQTMTWRRRVNWQRGVAVGTVTVDVETVGTDRGYTGGAWGAGPAWTLAITADTTNGAINIIGTGAAATNIRWLAEVQWGETTFA